MPVTTSKKKSRDLPRGPFFSSAFAPTFAASLLLYLFLLPPSVTRGGDGGELIAASYTLGIAHPSGYPIWCLLGRLFALVPLGEIAWRYNFFSALALAFAAGVLAETAQLLLTREESAPERRAQLAAIGASLLFTGFFFVGTQALLAEVYALAALEGAALLFFAIRWKQQSDWRDLYTLAFLAGLSPFVHLSGIFLWPPLGVWALWRQPGLTPARLLVLAGLFGAACLPALYLPIRSASFPAPPVAQLDQYLYFPLDWGHPATWSAWKNHLTAKQYSGLLKPRALPDLLKNLGSLAGFLLIQDLWATPLLVVGAWAAFKRRLGWILAAIFVFNIAVEIQYDVSDQPNFFFPAYLVMTLWMALGWFTFFGWLEKRGQKMARDSDSMWPWRLRMMGMLALLATIGAQWFLFGISAQGHGVVRIRDGALESAQAAQQLARRQGKSVMALWVADDTLWPFWYAKYALGAAPDVETLWGRGVARIQQAGQMADYVAQLKKSGPVVLAQWDEGTDARFPLVMLTPSGNLCEASDLALPPAATPLSTPPAKELSAPNGFIAARFRRAALWQKPGEPTPALSPASMAAFEVDFRVSPSIRSGGFIEVLLAKPGNLHSPSPQQQQMSEGSSETGHVLISKQIRRLILPPNAQNGQLLRAAVPLQIEATLPVGNYWVWTRLVASKTDSTTAWEKTDIVSLTSK